MSTFSFPGFGYSAEELSTYMFWNNLFVISTVSQQVIRYSPPAIEPFRTWLNNHEVRDITHEVGSLVINYYTGTED